jgi:hypothetical protein
LAEKDFDTLADAVVRHILGHFEALRKQSINDGVGGFGIEFRNSKDDPKLDIEQPNVARVILGGTIAELGIPTIGIAQYVDPGNFEPHDTAVVLLDLLSGDKKDPNSILSIPRAPGVTTIDAVARIVAAVAAHEIGHLLGFWHCRNDNNAFCLMDQGGNLRNTAGVQVNEALGPGDTRTQFITNEYADEGIALPGSMANTHIQVAFGLATGMLDPAAQRLALERDIFHSELMAARLSARVPARVPSGSGYTGGFGWSQAPNIMGMNDDELEPTRPLLFHSPSRATFPSGALPGMPSTEATADFWNRRLTHLRQKFPVSQTPESAVPK